MKKLLILGAMIALLGLQGFAVTKTVKAGGGGDYTTISACSAAIVGGDTCKVFSGTYAGWTQAASGSAGNLIRFTINTGDTVIINSQVDISSRSYIQLDHFAFTPASLIRCILGNGTTSHNVIDSNSFNKCQNSWRIPDGLGGGGSDNVFSNNTVNPNDLGNNVGIYLYGDRNRIEGNTFTSTDGDCMNIGGTNVIVRNNVCKTLDGGTSGQHIDFVQVQGAGTVPTLVYSLIENNSELSCTNDSHNCHFIIIRTGGTPAAQGNIVRFNFASGLDANGPVSFGGTGDTVPDNWFYNNTIGSSAQYAGNGSGASWQNAATGGAFNNIFYNVQTATNSWSPLYDFSAGGLTENGNLVFTPSYAGGFASPYSGEATYAALHSQDPNFSNYPTDATLNSGSPAIGAGVALTSAVGSGAASTSLTVGNAHPFQPGWAGTNADWIRIGTHPPVQISSINYTTNVITLASAATWSNTEPIYLYKDSSGTIKLAVASPNVGAYQFPSSIPTPPTTAVLFPNLQNSAGNPGTWTICNANNSCAAGTPSGIGSAALTFNFSSPLGASTLKFTNTTGVASPTGWNTLVYRHLGTCNLAQDGVTNVCVGNVQYTLMDQWIYWIPSPGGVVGPEYDPDFYVGNAWTYKTSIACYKSAAKIYLYDQSIQNWRATNIPCDWNTTGASTPHHIRLYNTLDQTGHTQTYQTLELDGIEVYNPTNPPTVTGAGSTTFGGWFHNSGNLVNIQFQADNNSVNGTSTEYLDLMNFYIWGAAPTPPATLTVTIAGGGTGTVTSSDGGINCAPTCVNSGIVAGTTLTMSSFPAVGSAFTGWSGDCTNASTGIPTIDADCGVTATFALTGTTSVVISGKTTISGKTVIQ